MTYRVKQLTIGVNGFPVQQLFIDTDNTVEEVLAAGYLGPAFNFTDVTFSNKQIAMVYTTDGGTAPYAVVVDANGIASLEPGDDNPTAVNIHGAPVVAGNFAAFYGTAGDIQDLTYSPSNAAKTKVVMADAATVVDELAAFADTAGTAKTTGIATNRVMQSAFNTPDTEANLVAFDVTVGFAALAAAGSVTLYTSSGAKQYKIRALWVNGGGTNFSGGGGDRLLAITDNTTVYSVVPAASLQTLANTGWGVTELPFPAAAAINVSTAAGASLVAKYSGGAADYTAGSVVISGILQRVA